MKEKKQSKDWYIAMTHYLTAGFAIPFIMGLVLGIPLSVMFAGNPILLVTVSSLIGILGVWLGVIYSARYVNKTYIIRNSDKIVKLATAYLIVVVVLFNIPSRMPNLAWFIEIGLFIIEVIIFYSLSKKYIKNTEDNIAPQQ